MERNRNEVREADQIKIEPFTLVYDILVNWWVILLGVIAAALLTYVVVSVRYVPQYSTSATFAITSRGNASSMSTLGSANEMAQTFEKILQSNVMRKKVREKLGIEVDSAQITTQVIEGTNLLVLRVTASSPKEAIDLMRTIRENYSKVSYYSVGDTVMDVLEEPKVPFYPDNPLNVRDVVKKGMLFGGVFLIAIFGLLSYLKDSIKREEDVEEKLDAKHLGTIAFSRKYRTIKEAIKREKKALLVTEPLAEFSFVESYKKLATKVDYQMMKGKRQVLVVTSVAENEGKSTVAANLAIELAQQSKKVLLVEGDLRRPSQFLVFGQEPDEASEIGEYLKGDGKLRDIVKKSNIPGLYFILGRNCYSSSTEILHSEKLKKLMDFGRKAVDYVIIDSPPAGFMGDAEVLADAADAVLLVVKQNYMHAEDINDVLDAFREHYSKVLGVVLNGVRTFSDVPMGNYYGKYGRYGKYGKYGNYNRSKGIEEDEQL